MTMTDKTLDDMTEPELRVVMQRVAKACDDALPPRSGFIVLAAPFHQGGSAQYVSNAERTDCLSWLKETVERFEQHEEVPR